MNGDAYKISDASCDQEMTKFTEIPWESGSQVKSQFGPPFKSHDEKNSTLIQYEKDVCKR